VAEAAYFRMINEQGGVNGRKIDFISLDDGYSPPKTVEQTRRLVEQEGVALIFHTLGAPTNISIRKYLNDHKVPQVFIASGSSKFVDPEHFPWTMPFLPILRTEGLIYANYILRSKPDAKIGVLYQNDDFGKDYLTGIKEGLGEKASKMIVKELTYESTDPTIDTQIVLLQDSGADTFIDVTLPKFAAQAIRKSHDIGWLPTHILIAPSNSVAAVLEPAGIQNALGLITAQYLKDPTDPQWNDDHGYRDWAAWMKNYNPQGNPIEPLNVYGYTAAQVMVQVLKQCGNDVGRYNVMKQAANLHDVELPMLLPGVKINTSPTDYRPIKQMRLAKFDGKRWVLFGDLIEGPADQ